MKRRIAFFVNFMILTSLSLAAQHVTIRYDHSYDFSRVKTFTVEITPAWDNPAVEGYAEEVVAAELHSKGWVRVPDQSSADVRVVIKGTVEQRKYEESYYNGGIQVPAGVSGPAGVTNSRVIQQELGEGTLNIFDTKTNDLVFSASGTVEVSHQDKKNEKTIKKGIVKAFKQLRPKTGA